MSKIPLGINVLEAANARIKRVFDDFPRIYVSFSGGKDSTVLLHLAMEEAIRRNRKIGVLFIDFEAQYRHTIDHIESMYALYADHIEPYWISLPIILRNAVSMYEPRWMCWEPGREDDWIRTPPSIAITDPEYLPFFRVGMEFEEFTPAFGHWYSQRQPTACLVGIRSDESLNRYRTLIADKTRYDNLSWTTWTGKTTYNAYPIYDWRTQDVWIYHATTGKPYNHLYDLMHQAGLSIHQQRICQPYGDDQRKGLWLYHIIEPETWGKVVARVNGANSGALYSRDSGNIQGVQKITLPDGHTWESFARMLLDTLPPLAKEHYSNKITIFLRWWELRGYPNGIPDEADPNDEAKKQVPSWRRICKALLRNDYWCKGLSFSQTKSESYEKYRKIMRNRKRQWGVTW